MPVIADEGYAPDDSWLDEEPGEGTGPVADAETVRDEHKERMRRSLLTTQQLFDMPPPVPLVGGLLDLDSTAMMYGPSGHGKSFVAIDLALHVAGGIGYWHTKDRTVTNGPVVYVVAEGVSGVGPRVRAWAAHHQAHRIAERPIYWYPKPVALFPPNPRDAMSVEAELFAEILAEIVPLKPVMVVLDTVARCSMGAEENSSKDMGKVIAAADLIKEATGACVLLVHHSGKDLGNGARGSSAMRAAMDTEIEVVLKNDEIVVTVTKQKNHGESDPMKFTLDEAADSVVLVPSWKAGDAELTKSVAMVLEILMEIATEEGVTKSVWRDVATDDSVSRHVSRPTFYRAVKKLLDDGLVSNVGTDKQPRYVPVSAGQSADPAVDF